MTTKTLLDSLKDRIPHVNSIGALKSTSGGDIEAVEVRSLMRGGTFIYAGSGFEVDNGVVFPAAGGGYWVRQYTGPADVRWWGAVGDASDESASKNTTAFNQAIGYVSASASAALEGSSPRQKNRPATLYAPSGTYHVNQPINIPGTLHLIGDGFLSYGGTFIYQIASNAHLFTVTGSADGGNCAVQIENIRLRGYGSASPTASLVYCDESIASANSLYLNRVGFQGWERFAISVKKTDDLQVTSCIFDGATNYCFSLGGDADHPATNAVFSNNTFYGIQGGLGYLGTVDGFTFAYNRIYGGSVEHTELNTGFGIDGLNPGLTQKRVSITNNHFDRVEKVFATRSDGWDFSHNTITNTNSAVIEIGGGGIVRYAKVIGNTAFGTWAKTFELNGQSINDAPVWAYGTGVLKSVFTGNVFAASGNPPTAYYLPDNRTGFNVFNNVTDGFTTPYTVANAGQNTLGYQ